MLLATLIVTAASCTLLPLGGPLIDATATHLPPRHAVPCNSMAVQVADLDGDGDLDVVVAQEFLPNKILRNEGGRFIDASDLLPELDAVPLGSGPPGHDSEDVSIADFDGDGILDLVFVSEDDMKLGRRNVHEFYRGGKDGRYERIEGALPDSEANTVAHADVNGDGRIDLFIGGAGQDLLLVNAGGGRFVDESRERLPREGAVAQDAEFVDVDRDGDVDLVLGLEGGHALWINQGDGRFVDETRERLPWLGALVEARRIVPHDVDGDGHLDLYIAHVGWMGRDPQDRLYRNDGTGRFVDVTKEWLPSERDTSLDASFADLDGDGRAELLRATMGPLVVWTRDGDRFVDATDRFLAMPVTAQILALAVEDFDKDGALDVYVACLAGPQQDHRGFDRLLLGSRRPS
jgi:hypothetical protein